MGLSKIKAGLPLAAALSLIAALVGILWAAQPPSAPPGNPASAEVASTPQDEPKPTPPPAIVTPPGTETAPEFRGITAWLNSPPLAMADQRDRVVLIDLWTYS